ncbi:membrane bound O-acyl transferase family-domain-containing protein [Lentinula aff. detonsa]|uniref:Membrane bound O-acyl transferase family-domain-containing protein n=1 Tax=Lentinula aff. detonsa TaxID=2804958 RepID=A0AA38KME7_9AGAR|nr:membrane bound O-acyl transferase family-domain-containing protein [Lentinula aff. detonsa]KAJ3799001.1 membrane bound O-acyl transferase family-domain-containing protein [Lentinula aff. detonsa]
MHLQILAALSKCISTAGMVVRPLPHRWVFFLPVVAINSYCYFSKVSDDSIRSNVIIETLIASDYILLTDIQRELRQIGQRESIMNAGIWDRLKWTLQLLCSPRGIGWTHEQTSIIPPHAHLSRLDFLRNRLIALVMAIIGNDIAFILTSIDPGFSRDAVTYYEQPFLWRFWATGLFFFRLKSSIQVYLLLITLLLVSTGLSEPDTWPDFFGRLADAYTVRRWWGRVWHQQLRRIVSSHGKFLSRHVFGLLPGTIASSYAQLYVAFFLSGLIHVTSFDPRPICFFLLQAVTITFEDFIISVARKAGAQSSFAVHILGYVWVYCSLTVTFGIWLDSMNSAGIGDYAGTLILNRYHGSWLSNESLPLRGNPEA